MEILTAGAPPVTRHSGAGGALVLLVLVIAIVLAMGAMRTASAVLWSLTRELVDGLWASVKAIALLTVALFCVVLLALGGNGGTTGSQPVDTAPSVGERPDTGGPGPR